MALHDAQEGAEKIKAELELERQGTAKLELKIKEVTIVWCSSPSQGLRWNIYSLY